MDARPWRALDGPGRWRRVALVLMPVAVLGAIFWGLARVVSWEHLGKLPPGYEQFDDGPLEVYAPTGMAALARSLATDARRMLEQVPRAYGGLAGGLDPPHTRVRVTLFEDHAVFRRFASAGLGVDLSNNGGYFDPSTSEIALVIGGLTPVAGLDAETLTRMAVRHEVAHLLLEQGGARLLTGMPPWLAEGLAMHFENADPADPSREAPLLPWVSQALRGRIVAPPALDTLLGMATDAFRSSNAIAAYAWSHLLVRFLMSEVPDRFWSLVRRARTPGRRPEEVADELEALRDLQPAWTAWVRARASER